MIKNISSQLKNNKMIGAEPMFQKLKILIFYHYKNYSMKIVLDEKILIMKNSIFLKINDYLLYIKLMIFIIFFIIIKGY